MDGSVERAGDPTPQGSSGLENGRGGGFQLVAADWEYDAKALTEFWPRDQLATSENPGEAGGGLCKGAGQGGGVVGGEGGGVVGGEGGGAGKNVVAIGAVVKYLDNEYIAIGALICHSFFAAFEPDNVIHPLSINFCEYWWYTVLLKPRLTAFYSGSNGSTQLCRIIWISVQYSVCFHASISPKIWHIVCWYVTSKRHIMVEHLS